MRTVPTAAGTPGIWLAAPLLLAAIAVAVATHRQTKLLAVMLNIAGIRALVLGMDEVHVAT